MLQHSRRPGAATEQASAVGFQHHREADGFPALVDRRQAKLTADVEGAQVQDAAPVDLRPAETIDRFQGGGVPLDRDGTGIKRDHLDHLAPAAAIDVGEGIAPRGHVGRHVGAEAVARRPVVRLGQ